MRKGCRAAPSHAATTFGCGSAAPHSYTHRLQKINKKRAAELDEARAEAAGLSQRVAELGEEVLALQAQLAEANRWAAEEAERGRSGMWLWWVRLWSCRCEAAPCKAQRATAGCPFSTVLAQRVPIAPLGPPRCPRMWWSQPAGARQWEGWGCCNVMWRGLSTTPSCLAPHYNTYLVARVDVQVPGGGAVYCLRGSGHPGGHLGGRGQHQRGGGGPAAAGARCRQTQSVARGPPGDVTIYQVLRGCACPQVEDREALHAVARTTVRVGKGGMTM